jgi:hypothetical protein
MEDHRMRGNMHQARSSKEMQYEEKSYWSNSLFYISAQPQYPGNKSTLPWVCYCWLAAEGSRPAVDFTKLFLT